MAWMTENSASQDVLTVVGYEDIEERGLAERRLVRREVDADQLGARVTAFLGSLRKVLGQQPDEIGPYKLDTISVTAEVSAKGAVGLLGTGTELAGKGGGSFSFKRTT